MGDKQEQGWLTSILDQTDKLILTLGGYESSTGEERFQIHRYQVRMILGFSSEGFPCCLML